MSSQSVKKPIVCKFAVLTGVKYCDINYYRHPFSSIADRNFLQLVTIADPDQTSTFTARFHSLIFCGM